MRLRSLPQSLRIHPEPHVVVDEATVHRLIDADPTRYLNEVRARLKAIATGEATVEMPPKRIFDDPVGPGDFRVMPCVVRHGGQADKIVKVVGTNIGGVIVPDQVTVGKALRLHPVENFVTHVFEACLLSSARTGASLALAIEALRPASDDIALVGCGRVAYYTARLLAREGRRLHLADLRPEHAQQMADDLAEAGTPGRITVTEAPYEYDAIVLATTSQVPILHPGDTTARLVVSCGADTDNQRELGEEWAVAADLYVDTRDSTHVGDLLAWSQSGITPEIHGDLLDLVRAPIHAGARTVFISTGMALMDNVTIAYLCSELDKSPSLAVTESTVVL